MSQRKKKNERRVKLDSLEQIRPNAAGLDVAAEEIWACIPERCTEENVRRFETFTASLHRLADWLEEHGVETVAMESTGVYWIPLYEILEARGLELCLAHARTARNVSGRKSDVLDCQWIQQLHTYGLLSASFRPPADICTLRAYVRQRESVLRQQTVHTQHMQKALHLMNIKLTSVVSDITGLTGMQIIRAILAGERQPMRLAELRDPRLKASQEEIAEALNGHYQPEHLFALHQAVEAFDFHTRQLADCERELEAQYVLFEPQVDIQEHPLPGNQRRRNNHPDYDLRAYLYILCGVDLIAVDGLDSLLVQDILAEVGIDMSRWPTEKHFASWLGIAPNNKGSSSPIVQLS